MATLQQLEAGLRAAMNAGNTDYAKAIGAEMVKMRQPQQAIDPTRGEGNIARKIEPETFLEKNVPVPEGKGFPQPLVDFATGYTGLSRAALNTPQKIYNFATGNKEKGGENFGDLLMPGDMSTGGGFETAGNIADPVSWAIGGGVGKVLPYAPLFGKAGGFLKGTAQNVLSGATTGGIIGGLSEDQTIGEGAGIGAVAGGLIPLGAELGGMAYRGGRNLIEPHLGKAGLDRATSRLMNQVVGDKRGAYINALEMPQTSITQPTASQQAVRAGSTEMAALEDIARPFNPNKYDAIDEMQQAGRSRVAGAIAQDKTAMDAARKARSTVTDPLRESAIENANVFGQKAPQLYKKIAEKEKAIVGGLRGEGFSKTAAAQQKVLSENWRPIFGQPKLPARYSPNIPRIGEAQDAATDYATAVTQRKAEKKFLENQLNSLWTSGNRPLTSKSIISGINKKLSTPGLESSEMITKVLPKVKERIEAFTKRGVIDANNLYTIRKDIANYIEDAAGANKKWDSKLTAKLQKDVQGMIDDAIDDAAGGGWKAYLKKYAEMSKPLNQMKVGQTLESALDAPLASERPGVFANALRTAEQKISKKSGKPIIEDLTGAQRNDIAKILTELRRDKRVGEMSSKGMGAAKRVVGDFGTPVEFPNFLNTVATATRSILRRLEGGGSKMIMENISDIMADPQITAEVMKKITPTQQKYLLEAIATRAGTIGAIQGAK